MPDFDPLDVKKLMDVVRHESVRLGLRKFKFISDGETSFTLALALSAAVKKVFFEKSETTFSAEPRIERKLVTQFAHRMRVDAMEKFNAPTVFSVVEFAVNEEAIEKKQYLVAILVYLEKDFLPEFLRLLHYPYVDIEEDLEVRDGCGTLTNLIAGQYKKELANLGYRDLMISPFDSYINTAPDGIGIPQGAVEKFDISFEVEGAKRLVVELVSLNMLPKGSAKDKEAPKKILIIDDDMAFVKTIGPFLRSQGFDVLIARDGIEGINRLNERPHLVILDIKMPGMDGYEFVVAKKKIESGSYQVPVIVLTAKEGLQDMFRVEGVREYLLKPFQPAALLKSIERCL